MKYFTLIFLSFFYADGFPVTQENFEQSPIKIFNFMKQYGYLKDNKKTSADLYTEKSLKGALKEVQKFGAINQTGILDEATLQLIRSPRCGNPDVVKEKRAKRFTFGSRGWNKRDLTFYLANWSSRLGEETVNRLIGKALKTWGNSGGLTFSRKATPDADIIVSFAKGGHNDPFPFDGPGYVLAHAYFPNGGAGIDGDIHFDDDEDWIESIPGRELQSGTDFYSVALHELGHSLGLGHSTDSRAVMFAYYKGGDGGTQLSEDDIQAIYQLYGLRTIQEVQTTGSSPTRRPPTTRQHNNTTTKTSYSSRTTNRHTVHPHYSTTPEYADRKEYPVSMDRNVPNQNHPSTYPTKEWTDHPVTRNYDSKQEPRIFYNTDRNYAFSSKVPNIEEMSTRTIIPDICQGNFDTVANLRGELFIFKDQYLWRFQDKLRSMPGYPVPIDRMFQFLPAKKIDAAYQRMDGNLVFFSGDQYWVHDGRNLVENSPKYIVDYGIPLRSGGIDAISNFAKPGEINLYQGNRVWKYNEIKKINELERPEDLGLRNDFPAHLDAIFTWNDGKTYFIKGSQYWTFDGKESAIALDRPGSFTRDWLGC